MILHSVVFCSWGSTSQYSSNWFQRMNFMQMRSQYPNPHSKSEYFLQSLYLHWVHMIYLSETARFQLSKGLSILSVLHKMLPQVHLTLSKSMSFRGWQGFKEKTFLLIDSSVSSLSHASMCVSRTCWWEAGSKAEKQERKACGSSVY